MAKWKTPPREMEKQIVLQLRHIVQVAVFQFNLELVAATPVLSGQLANNWKWSTKTPLSITTPGPSTTFSESYRTAKEALDGYILGDRICLRNNLPYAARIEFDGWSRIKAPAGMLRITAARWPRIVDRSVKAVLSEGGGNVAK